MDLPGSGVMNLLSEAYGLTPREVEIVRLVCLGLENQAVSDELYVSIHTVKHHMTAIFHKLKVKNRIELANFLGHLGRGSEALPGSHNSRISK